MQTQDIYSILKIILKSIKDKDLIWHLDGSANLILQGVKTYVKDLDITTTQRGIDIFRQTLNKYIIKDFYNQKNQCPSLICKIDNFEIEINAYGNRKFDMFDKTKIINWQGLKIPVLPLKYAKKFYQAINRKEKVNLINEYL